MHGALEYFFSYFYHNCLLICGRKQVFFSAEKMIVPYLVAYFYSNTKKWQWFRHLYLWHRQSADTYKSRIKTGIWSLKSTMTELVLNIINLSDITMQSRISTAITLSLCSGWQNGICIITIKILQRAVTYWQKIFHSLYICISKQKPRAQLQQLFTII